MFCAAIGDAVSVTTCDVLDIDGKIGAEFLLGNSGKFFANKGQCLTIMKLKSPPGKTTNCWDTMEGYCIANQAKHSDDAIISKHTQCTKEEGAGFKVKTILDLKADAVGSGVTADFALNDKVSSTVSSGAGLAAFNDNLKAATVVAVAYMQEEIGLSANDTASFGIPPSVLTAVFNAVQADSGQTNLNDMLATDVAALDLADLELAAVDSITVEGASAGSTSDASRFFATAALGIMMLLKLLL